MISASTEWCTVRPLGPTDRIDPDPDALDGLLTDANDAAREYSASVLDRALGRAGSMTSTDHVRLDSAHALGPALFGLVDHLLDGSPPSPSLARGDAQPPGTPGGLMAALERGESCRYEAVGARHRVFRRLEEHVRRLGWRDPRVRLVVMGPGAVFEAPAAPRHLVVQAGGPTTVVVDGRAPIVVDSSGGLVLRDAHLDVRAERLVALLSVVCSGDDPMGADELARSTPVSSSLLAHHLTVARRGGAAPESAVALAVRYHHPGGAHPIAGVGFASAGSVWEVPPRLVGAVGRLLSGPPVTVGELGEIAGLDLAAALDATLQLVRLGLCEPCDASEPLT